MNLDPISTTQLDPLISQWFDLWPNGITPKIANPPMSALDALGYYLVMKTSEYRLQVGDFCVMYKDLYPDLYEQKAQQFFVQTQTVEVWASVCRQVPFYVRVPGLLYSHYRVVASVDDPVKQQEYLQHCANSGMRVRQFEKWVAEQRGLPVPPNYEDRKFIETLNEQNQVNQLTRINSDYSLRLNEAETENERLRQQLDALQSKPVSLSPETLPAYAQKAIGDLANLLAGDITGYASVTVFSDRRVLWTPKLQ